jgi:hypothetical protein
VKPSGAQGGQLNLQQPKHTLFMLLGFALLGAAGLLKLPSVVAGERSAAFDDATQTKIARAMSAEPDDIARSAKIIDTNANGSMVVLREGNNGFTCMPGNPEVIGEPPMCVDAASLQWFAHAKAHRPKPTNTVPGNTYMLAGATQRSDTDANDKTSPAIHVGPHWMIMWPFDPKTTGLPTAHRDHGAYIIWAGSPYAHLHVMDRP